MLAHPVHIELFTTGHVYLGTAKTDTANLARIVSYLEARVWPWEYYTIGVGCGRLDNFDDCLTQKLVLTSSDLFQ